MLRSVVSLSAVTAQLLVVQLRFVICLIPRLQIIPPLVVIRIGVIKSTDPIRIAR